MSKAAALTDLILERLAPFPRSHFLSAGDLNAATTPPLSSGTWHVAVHGYSAATYTLKVVVE